MRAKNKGTCLTEFNRRFESSLQEVWSPQSHLSPLFVGRKSCGRYGNFFLPFRPHSSQNFGAGNLGAGKSGAGLTGIPPISMNTFLSILINEIDTTLHIEILCNSSDETEVERVLAHD
jgi:hypothetical protein